MKLTEKEILSIKNIFFSMKSKEDLLLLLNFVKKIIYGNKAIPFKITQVNYHINPQLNPKRYIQFHIPKKNGNLRTINSPCNGLKQIQYCLNIIFQVLYKPHRNAFGFIQGKSIVENAKIHIGNIYIYNIDLTDFFSNIDQARVWGRLQHPPFNLNKKENRLEIANMIAVLCCHEIGVVQNKDSKASEIIQRFVLPQGAPTSPILTNIICERLDYLLTAVAKRFGLRYSRYADDITFSSMHNVYQKDGEFIKELTRIIEEQGFTIKDSKTRLQKEGYRQEVTGLIVSDRVNVSKRYIKELRKWLYYWETYGYQKAYSFFYPIYKQDKGYIKKGEPNMSNILSGKLEYLKMVKGANNSTYMNLKKRYEELITESQETSSVTTILDIWSNNGIEEAMKFFYSR